jgi:hypothetical protein
VITITGIGDHLRPEWPITITGMRSGDLGQIALVEHRELEGAGIEPGANLRADRVDRGAQSVSRLDLRLRFWREIRKYS